jgi:hypothetical protein
MKTSPILSRVVTRDHVRVRSAVFLELPVSKVSEPLADLRLDLLDPCCQPGSECPLIEQVDGDDEVMPSVGRSP